MKHSPGQPRFQKVLCPIDFSGSSKAALRYAHALAAPDGGTITALYVNDPLLLGTVAAVYHGRDQFVRDSERELGRFVDSVLSASARESTPVSCRVSVGKPDQEILAAARRLRADVIVMGTHGLGRISRVFLGSTTRQVLERTTVPVFAVPRRTG
jgi:nucleotide-binding universal stress UspA family protein